MYPENQTQINPQTTGVDYLNQIAPPAPPTGFDKKTKIIILIMAVVGLLGLSFIFYMAARTNSGASTSEVIVKVNKLQAVTTKYKDKLGSSQLIEVNSSLRSILTTAQKSAEPIATAENIDVKGLVKVAGFEVELMEKLDSAYLNSNLDSTYIREMTFHIEELTVKMQNLLNKTKKTDVREFLTKTIADTQNIQKRLSELRS